MLSTVIRCGSPGVTRDDCDKAVTSGKLAFKDSDKGSTCLLELQHCRCYRCNELLPSRLSKTSRQPLYMGPKPPCAKYQYVVTPTGPKILPVEDPLLKDEESPADYNAGGYLPVKVNDTFKNGRYRVVRKLGSVSIIN